MNGTGSYGHLSYIVKFKIQIKYLICKFYFCSSWSFGSRKIWQIMWYVVFRCYNVYIVSIMYYVRVITGSIPHDKYTFLNQLSLCKTNLQQHFIIYITQILIERPPVLKDQTFFEKKWVILQDRFHYTKMYMEKLLYHKASFICTGECLVKYWYMIFEARQFSFDMRELIELVFCRLLEIYFNRLKVIKNSNIV